jgi:lysophospholipase L1-like esterase
VASWAASPQPSGPKPVVFNGETLREVVHVSAGGDSIRLHLSNAYGKTPLEVAAVHVALSVGGAGGTVAGSDQAVLFGGAATVIVPPAGVAVSDPVSLRVAPRSDVAVSLFFAGSAAATTVHALANRDAYASAPGDVTRAPAFPPARTLGSWPFLSELDVRAAPGTRTVVAFGDSITDGMGSTHGENHRWSDLLSDRLQARAHEAGVVNAGIAGNRLLAKLVGDSGLDRFERDVLSVPGVSAVVVLIGINDLAAHAPEPESSAEDVIAGQKKLLAAAKARGVRVLGGTLLPFEGTDGDGFFLPSDEPKRQAVNAWIRSAGAYAAVVDFDRVLADPSHPARIAPAFDSGDHLHPNDAGYQAMADAIDVALRALE